MTRSFSSGSRKIPRWSKVRLGISDGACQLPFAIEKRGKRPNSTFPHTLHAGNAGLKSAPQNKFRPAVTRQGVLVDHSNTSRTTMRKDSGIVIPQADSAVRTTRSFDQSYVHLSPCDHVLKKEG